MVDKNPWNPLVFSVPMSSRERKNKLKMGKTLDTENRKHHPGEDRSSQDGGERRSQADSCARWTGRQGSGMNVMQNRILLGGGLDNF